MKKKKKNHDSRHKLHESRFVLFAMNRPNYLYIAEGTRFELSSLLYLVPYIFEARALAIAWYLYGVSLSDPAKNFYNSSRYASTRVLTPEPPEKKHSEIRSLHDVVSAKIPLKPNPCFSCRTPACCRCFVTLWPPDPAVAIALSRQHPNGDVLHLHPRPLCHELVNKKVSAVSTPSTFETQLLRFYSTPSCLPLWPFSILGLHAQPITVSSFNSVQDHCAAAPRPHQDLCLTRRVHIPVCVHSKDVFFCLLLVFASCAFILCSR